MHIKSIVAGAAIALAATVGAASAADQFATVEGIAAESMNSAEMAQVRGEGFVMFVVGVPDAVAVDQTHNDVTLSTVSNELTITVINLPDPPL